MSTGSLWGGRFKESVGQQMQEFGASLPVDIRLYEQDIRGSIAHANMLCVQGVISTSDKQLITDGLRDILKDIQAGNDEFLDIKHEDIHMAIEAELTSRIGAAGKRLHTARSRNDQVATDTRLYVREAAESLCLAICSVRSAIISVASNHTDAIFPGYTHLQRAQPILLSHHLLAWQNMLERDYARMLASKASADVLVLGSAALAGTTYDINRFAVAKELDFASVSNNSLDAVSDRDFICDITYACAMVMMHLSRICEELILWSSSEFGFITLSDAFSTGSSIMPQKKNPDFAELTRGKTGRVYGNLIGILTTLKSLPLAYNKDMQEDKEGLFDSIDTVSLCLNAVSGMISTMHINANKMLEAAQGGFMAATDLADYLVKQGLAFRDAHEVVGKIVLFAEKNKLQLHQLSLAQLHQFSDVFGADALEVVKIANVVDARTTYGGTAKDQVLSQLEQAQQRLTQDIKASRTLPR
ncbi:MAG: argininosuccinate lyase [Coriobacteriales bacterium]|jgi:argininosuccinate lyase|nr:argininosuccinate lyase [Coriobacteriales bacterium]